MSEQEYREFWISKRSNEMLFSKAQLGSTIYVFNYKIEASSICAEEKDIFHVIEHRAFQAAQDKIQQLEYLLNKINENVVPGVMDSSEAGVYLIGKLEKKIKIMRDALNTGWPGEYGAFVMEFNRQALKDAEGVE